MKGRSISTGEMLRKFGFLGVILVIEDRQSEQYPVESLMLDDFLPAMDGLALLVWDGMSETEGEPVRLSSPGGYLEIETIRWHTVDGEPQVTVNFWAEDGQLKRGMTVDDIMAATALPMQA